MKTLLTILLLSNLIYSQYPYNESFDSFDGTDEWTSPSGNTGSDFGNLCINLAGNYLNSTSYIFESPTKDYSDCDVQVDYSFYLDINLRLWTDAVYIEAYDGGWTTLHGYTGWGSGLIVGSINSSVTAFRVRVETGTSGNRNGRYMHMDYFIVDCQNVLAVELIALESKPTTGGILIEWVTASEQDSDYFLIQRSNDAINWEHLESLHASGYSSMLKEYSVKDENPYQGTNYYRLIEVSLNGELDTLGVTTSDYLLNPIESYIEIATGREVNIPQSIGLYIKRTVILGRVTYEKIIIK